jgi:hypothetical protein
MIRFVADENLNGYIVAGVRRRLPKLDLITVMEAGLTGLTDPELLDWAAGENRVLLTHDVTTLIHFANQRLQLKLAMPGMIEITRRVRVRDAIEDLLLIAQCSEPGEWEGQVRFLPLK